MFKTKYEIRTLLGIVGIILVGIVLSNYYSYYKLKRSYHWDKNDQHVLNDISSLARILGVPRTLFDLSIGKTDLFFIHYEETPISTYLIRPERIYQVSGNCFALVVDAHDNVVARMDVTECKSLLIAKFKLLEQLSFTSAPLELRARGLRRINSLGNIGIMEEWTFSDNQIIVSELYFVRGGTIVHLVALPETTNLLEIAMTIDKALFWAIWRKRLLWLCVIVSLLAVLNLCLRKRTSGAKKRNEYTPSEMPKQDKQEEGKF
jgi:hypothetical protein